MKLSVTVFTAVAALVTSTVDAQPRCNTITGFYFEDNQGNNAGAVTKVNQLCTPIKKAVARYNSCRFNPIESVLIEYDGKKICEKDPTYAINGKFKVGGHYLKATPFTGKNCDGNRGKTKTLKFKIVKCDGGGGEGGCTNKVTGFSLEAKSGKSLGNLSNKIDLCDKPPINEIVAKIDSCDGKGKRIDSVLIEYDGKKICEKDPSYAINVNITPGSHTVKATPYTGKNCNGAKGPTKQQSFFAFGGSCNSCENEITGFSLLSKTGRRVGSLPKKLDLDDYTPPGLKEVIANYKSCKNNPIDSVEITYDSKTVCEKNLDPDYSIVPPQKGQFTKGNHKVTATPYEGPNCNGTKGKSSTKTFKIV